MRPPPISDHLSKDKNFPSQNPMITTSGKGRRLTSHCDQFWPDSLIVFALFLTSCKRPPELSTRTTKYRSSFRFSGAKIWNTLPLALRSEHDLIKFGVGLKRHFRSKLNWASSTFAILSCSHFFCICYCFLCCFFFSSGLHSNQPRWTGHPWLNVVQNKNK